LVGAAYGETDKVRTIIARGADVNDHGRIGNTARTLAAGYGQREIVEAFEIASPVQSSQNLVAGLF